MKILKTGICRMKNNHIVQLTGICIVVLSGLTISNVSAAETGLTSGEIKNIRHLSRALLQSRAIEKKRIEDEVDAERVDIKKMEDSLEQLIDSEKRAMSQVVLEPVKNTNSFTAVFKPEGLAVPAITPSTTEEGLVNAEVTSSAATKLKQDRLKRIQASKNTIASMRVSIDNKLPGPLEFWKKKSERDRRNEHAVRVATSVEKELEKMSQDNQIDIAKLKALKDKLSLKKPDINFDDIGPTYQTKTQHRAQ